MSAAGYFFALQPDMIITGPGTDADEEFYQLQEM